MKGILPKITALLLVIVLAAGLCSCTKSEYKSEKLLVYCDEAKLDYYKGLFKTYNSYCMGHDELGEDYQVDFVTFEGADELYTKMSAEIMAGGGPDIFITEDYLPFEKMIESGQFTDIDALLKEQGEKIDQSLYNEKVLNSGIFGGKRYLLPLVYSPRAYIADKNTLKKLGLSTEQNSVLTYADKEAVEKILSAKNEVGENYNLFDYASEKVLFNFISDYINFNTKETEFDSAEFKQNLDTVKELYASMTKNESLKSEDNDEQNGEAKSVFINCTQSFFQLLWTISSEVYPDKENGKTVFRNIEQLDNYVVYRAIQRNKTEVVGDIDFGIAINKNTTKREKACAFVKYALSEDGQSHFTNPRGYSSVGSYPINKNVLEKRIRQASEAENWNGFCPGIKNKVTQSFIDVVRNTGKCEIIHTYYGSKIVGELVTKYMTGKLPKNKFIRQLKTATKFYLEE